MPCSRTPVGAGTSVAGLDPAGFMRVFVVQGGVNLPPQALVGVDDPLNPINRRNQAPR